MWSLDHTTTRGAPQTLIISLFFSVNIEPIFIERHMYFTQSCNRVLSDLYLAYFVPQGDFWELSCAHGIELMITMRVFHQIVLCLNTPKIIHLGSDSGSLNQHWLVKS